MGSYAQVNLATLDWSELECFLTPNKVQNWAYLCQYFVPSNSDKLKLSQAKSIEYFSSFCIMCWLSFMNLMKFDNLKLNKKDVRHPIVCISLTHKHLKSKLLAWHQPFLIKLKHIDALGPTQLCVLLWLKLHWLHHINIRCKRHGQL